MAYRITDMCVGCGMCLKVCPAMAISGQPRKRHRVTGAACIDCGACGRICPHGAVLDAIGRKCARIRRRASNWPRPLIDYDRCVDCRACIDACPVNCLAIAFNQDAGDRRARPVLARPRDCIACRFCALECPADAVSMKPLSRMTAEEKLVLDGGFQE
ncbi:MAG: 4Fe-4S binding protein [Desulfobacterales bacterium]|nr:4Fe-4S binding protein [Desulfobacterales bacterium]MDJ0887178.1 4Fe-4S binding protein [Desulfobacterales bacterium]